MWWQHLSGTCPLCVQGQSAELGRHLVCTYLGRKCNSVPRVHTGLLLQLCGGNTRQPRSVCGRQRQEAEGVGGGWRHRHTGHQGVRHRRHDQQHCLASRYCHMLQPTWSSVGDCLVLRKGCLGFDNSMVQSASTGVKVNTSIGAVSPYFPKFISSCICTGHVELLAADFHSVYRPFGDAQQFAVVSPPPHNPLPPSPSITLELCTV